MGKYDLICGVQKTAIKTLIYGPEGIGKSTLAAMWPSPVYIDIEAGTKQLPVARLPRPTSWSMLLDELREVRDGGVNCSSVVIDTADAAERMCAAHIMARDGKKSIEEWGYGKGYTILQEEYGKLLDLCSEIVEHGRNVVLVGHSDLRKFERPDESGAYDRFELKLTKKVSPMVKEWADMVLFCDYKTYVETTKTGKAKATGGRRIIRTTHATTWDAKNRFGLPEELPLELGKMPKELAAAIPDMMTDAKPQESIGAAVKPAPVTTTAAPKKAAETPSQPATPTTTTTAPAYVRPNYPASFSKLVDLMAINHVTDEELRFNVGQTGNYPEDCAVADYEQGFVDYLVAGWPTFLNRIKSNREVAQAKSIPVPFK